jgi:hypothetical protein
MKINRMRLFMIVPNDFDNLIAILQELLRILISLSSKTDLYRVNYLKEVLLRFKSKYDYIFAYK